MKRFRRVISSVLMTVITATMINSNITFANDIPVSLNDNVVYTDISNHWAESAINRWSNYGIISGMSNDAFEPNENLTRAQLFALINRILGNNEKTDISKFTDVQSSAWYADDISKIVAAGIVSGDSGNTMRPNDNITREEMAIVFAKAFCLDTSDESNINKFEDKNNISSWSKGSVNAVVKAGFMNGTDNNKFSPKKNSTRAEAVKTIDNAIDLYINEDTTIKEDIQGNVLINAKNVTIDGANISGMLIIAEGKTEKIDIKNSVIENTVLIRGGNVSFDNIDLNKVIVLSNGAQITTTESTKINNLVIQSKDVSIIGKGKIINALIKENGANIETKPENVVLEENISAVIAGKEETGQKQPEVAKKKSNSVRFSGGGGSSSGGNNPGEDDKPDDNKPENESPDKSKIIASMTNIDTSKGFKIEEKISEVTENHKNHLESKSHPFSSMYCSVGEIDKLAKQLGYGEKEFFMHGFANVYGLSERGVNVPVIKTEGADYTTRLLIHYPEDANKFSGRIYIDILNASAGYDLEDIFRRSYEHMMETGDIYIGITSKTDTAQALKNFNSERYKDIDWLVDNNDANSGENGLFWDMLGQLGTVLKNRPEDMFASDLASKIKENGKVYLMGQSQSGFYLNTFLNAFYPYVNNINSGKDIFDGYVNLVGWINTELSTGVQLKDVGFAKTQEPFIVIMSEAEASINAYKRVGDKNDKDWKFRLYEVAGAPHADPTAAILPNNFEIAMANTKKDAEGNYTGTSRDMKTYTGNHIEGDLHLNEFTTAALVNIDKWAKNETGFTMPSGEQNWIKFDDTGKKLAKDEYGNALGGLRLPKIDAPIATYYPVINNTGAYATEGSMIYFTKEQLDKRYPNGLSQYQLEFKQSADNLLNKGLIVKEDYDNLINFSKNVSIFGNKDDVILNGQTSNIANIKEVENTKLNPMFNATSISVGELDDNWNEKAPVWVPKLQLNEDNTIQYVDRSGENDVVGDIKYKEKEFFVSGKANLYNITPDNVLGVKEEGLDYTNRMIVRTPEDSSKFNGKVYVDILNASDKYDNESLWRRAYGTIMQEGAAYVGITSKPVCVAALKSFNLERYKELSWESPNTYLASAYKIDKKNGQSYSAAEENYRINAGETPYTDIGFVWDILSQAGYNIKDNSINDKYFGTGAKDVTGIYLYGQSQSGFVMNEYFHFQDFLKEKGKSLPYDGFMNVVGTYPANKINQSDSTAIAVNDETGKYYIPKNLGVPVIYITSQMDFNSAFRRNTQTNVINKGDDKWALYEIASAPHSDPAAPVFPDNSILKQMGYSERNIFPTEFDQNQIISDYNSNMFVQGLLLKLDSWAKEGIAPPTLETPYINKIDDATVTGGLRSPQIDVPLATYYEKPIGSAFSTSGTMVPFTSEELIDKYKSADDYEKAFNEKADELLNKGLIGKTDANYMKKYSSIMKLKVEASLSVSPDKDKIISSMTNIDTSKGFKIEEKISEVTENHKNHSESKSHPFSSMYCSVGEIDKLAKQLGYGEKEFFMHGFANVYGLSEKGVNVPVIKTEGADYTTRLLVHYPEDANKFSGRIYIDILNASAGYDLEDIFRRSYEHMMKTGDIYIGITSKTITAQALKNFDSKRYKDIDWLVDNDNPKSGEDGLFWDILGQLGTVLKNRPEDLFASDLASKIKENGKVYLTGQSQSGFYLNTFLMAFYPYINNINDGKDIFDGYLNVVGATPTALSTGVPLKNTGFAKTEEPFIVIMSEAEASMSASMSYYTRLEDKNNADWKFRLYEVAGAPHADPTAAILPTNFEIAKANAKVDTNGNYVGTSRDLKAYVGNHVEGDVHLNEFVTAALVNMDKWARKTDFNMPNADKNWMKLDSTGKTIEKDEYGNSLGGLRLPKIDAPIATYYPVINNTGAYATEGSMIYFTKEQLNKRYSGGYAQYAKEFKQSADNLLKDNYIIQSDYDNLIEYCNNASIFNNTSSKILASQTAVPTAKDVTPDDMTKMFNSTAMSVSSSDRKDEWNQKAPVWAKSITLSDTRNVEGSISKHVEYSEKEYFISGNSNLYNLTPDNQLGLKDTNLPYTNRIIVRTPKNPEDFSGKVYVDVLNATSGFDSEALWRRSNTMIMETGSAYVGITSKPMIIEALKKFDSRYDELSWASPNTYIFSNYKINIANGQTAQEAEANFVPQEVPATDIGLVWDILSQTGNLIKNNGGELFGTSDKEINSYLFGQSQSGFYVNTYAVFQKFLEEQGISELPYDGLMTMVGTAQGAMRINQSDKTVPFNKTGKVEFMGNVYDMNYYIPNNLKTPFIVATTENDLSTAFRTDNGSNVINTDNVKYAVYEMAGTPHSDDVSPTFPSAQYLQKAGIKGDKAFEALEKEKGTDINSNMFVKSLLVQLDNWAQNGTAPMTSNYISTDEKGKVIADEYGNALGGLRSPQIDVPLVKYMKNGTMEKLSDDLLNELYPNKEDYIAKFNVSLELLKTVLTSTDITCLEQYRDKKAEELYPSLLSLELTETSTVEISTEQTTNEEISKDETTEQTTKDETLSDESTEQTTGAETPKDEALDDSNAETPKDEALDDSNAEAPKDEVLDDSNTEAPKDEVLDDSNTEAPKDEVLDDSNAEAPKDEVLDDSNAEAPKDKVLDDSNTEAPKDKALKASSVEL